jgi:hypothetical protein
MSQHLIGDSMKVTRFYVVVIWLPGGTYLETNWTNPPTKQEIAQRVEEDNPDNPDAVMRVKALVFADNYTTLVKELIHNV